MTMKKTDYNNYNRFASDVADGLDFEYGEGKKMSKRSSRLRKVEQQNDWLKIQEAELANLTLQTRDALSEDLDRVSLGLNANMKASKQQTKAQLKYLFAQESALAA